MKGIFIETPDTGICKVNVDLVVKKWNKKKWCIAQWEYEYRLCLMRGKESGIKATISEQQAKEIITKLDLWCVQSGFRSGKTWKSIETISETLIKIRKMVDEKQMELQISRQMLSFYSNPTKL